MARPRSPNRDKAFKIFKRQKGNISNKELAKILEEDPKTVSKWKTLDEWAKKINYSKEKNVTSKNKEKNPSINGAKEVDTIDIEVEMEINQIVEVEEMNEKHLLFCIYYVQSFNATKAYQKAYQCGRTTAMVNGCKLLSKTNVQIAISKLKQNRLNRAMIKPEDIFQKYLDIAYADITDYITFGKEDYLAGMEVDGTSIYKKCNFIDFKDSEEIDGSLITEFKEGKNGFSIKLKDSMKALEWLSEHMDMATTDQKDKLQLARDRFEHEKDIDSKKYW